jgi:hypothetical protein
MNFKNITLADVSTEAKVETLGIVLDKKIEELSSAVYSVAKEKGEQGDRGQKGDKGDKGDQGIPGKNGNDGINGINGKDGLNGKDGEDGEKAPKIVDAEIAIDDTLLLTLSDGSQIKTTKQVVGERGSNGSNGANGSKGDKGDPGETGAAGVGIASGGTTDQVLAKNSSTDYDTKWTTLGTMSIQNANAVAITGGTINGTTVGSTTPAAGKFTTLEATGNTDLGTGSANYIDVAGGAATVAPVISAQGSDTNITLVLQPKGTGALQAQKTDSTATGGNARGAYAIDWQLARGAATQVASGYYNIIGGGYANTGTANAAVTTQSGTMNATTAVTLSGSNASIRIGQYITGTSIAADTYVANISGTSLTLSQAASGSSTSTLSFFAPHGVVVGGGNNQATGIYSFIGGGGDAGTAANRNVASGAYSVVVGGRNNQATGQASFIGCGGYVANIAGNTASGNLSAVVSGVLCTASAEGAFIGNGYINVASGLYSTIAGGVRGTTRSIVGNAVFPACSNPIADALGINQAALLVLAVQTTDATATALRSNSSAASGTNQVILPNNSAYFFRGEVVSGKTAGGDTKGWTIEGVIKRGANAASTALVGTPTIVSTYADAGAATWAIAVTADTTNGGIRVTFTGQAATTIRTVCQIRTTEMTF